jgi:hypothetical protein
MLELRELQALALEYESELKKQLKLKREVAKIESDIKARQDAVVAEGYNSGEIDGKNASIRSAQEAARIIGDEELAGLRDDLPKYESRLAEATAGVRALEAEIGLTKAWLYGQANIG